MKKKTNKKKPSKKLDELSLELHGDVYLVEKSGNKVSKSKIDGKTVLGIINRALEEGLGMLENKE